jgi:hypothetical protein
MATADRVQERGFWPTKGEAARGEYVGPAVCARCHTERAATQAGTAMAGTAARADESIVLRGHDALAFQGGPYSYRIARGTHDSTYTVTDGKDPAHAVSAILKWAFGVGHVGQSYLYESGGQIYEGRASYFADIDGLDYTPGRALDAPHDVGEAAARIVDEKELRRCFACHTTASVAGGTLDLAHAIPGVTCEACHGPGARHVAAVEDGRNADIKPAISVTRRSDPMASVDFCGACHGTWWDVTLAGEKGVAALRSQPYRLESSRCWRSGDPRLACTACHDPHQPLVRDAVSYDGHCLSCHDAGPAKAARSRACPVANQGCVTCHMPKYDVPEMHHKFTDHWIRVVRRAD